MKTIKLFDEEALFLSDILHDKVEFLKERNSRLSVDVEHQIKIEKLLKKVDSQVYTLKQE